MHRGTLEVQQRVLGPEHPGTLHSATNLAIVYSKQGNLEEAGRRAEGLATGETLHPLQDAFWEKHGLQCGFCTPGQVMSAVALLDSNPNPTREEARQAMSGNLCRCGAYDHYLNSVMRAAKV